MSTFFTVSRARGARRTLDDSGVRSAVCEVVLVHARRSSSPAQAAVNLGEAMRGAQAPAPAVQLEVVATQA